MTITFCGDFACGMSCLLLFIIYYRKLSRKEMALHCRQTTRGVHQTVEMLETLFKLFDSDQGKDTMGVPLLNHDHIWEQWRTNKVHVACIQDPPGIPLYQKTGSLKKCGIELPVFRCARGTTSLESFHLHLARFIPGMFFINISFIIIFFYNYL